MTLNRDVSVGQATGAGILSVTGGLTAGSAGTKTVTFGSTGFLGSVAVGTTGISDGSGTVAVNVAGAATTFSAANTLLRQYFGNDGVTKAIQSTRFAK